MHIYIYIQIHIYIFTNKNFHIYINTYIHIYICSYLHIYIFFICTYLHKCIYTHIHICMYTYLLIYIYTYILHKYIYTYIHININTNTYLHIYVYTYVYIHFYVRGIFFPQKGGFSWPDSFFRGFFIHAACNIIMCFSRWSWFSAAVWAWPDGHLIISFDTMIYMYIEFYHCVSWCQIRLCYIIW